MKKMLVVVSGLLVAVMSLISCNEAVSERLADVDSFVCEAPDSALAVLDSIPLSSLRTREQRARYALLKSVALDKNCIDVKSDSIIAPAVKYYGRHGAPDERLRAYYYRGLVSYYSHDYDEAMEWFVKGCRYSDESEDIRTSALLYFKMHQVYDYMLDWGKAMRCAENSSELFLASGDTTFYFEALDCALREGLALERHDTASVFLEKMWQLKDKIDLSQLSEIYASSLQLKMSMNTIQIADIEDYLRAVPDDNLTDWITVADAYYKCGDCVSSIRALDNYDAEFADNSAAYNSVLAHSSYGVGDYKRAFDAYSRYASLIGEQEQKSLMSEARFVEERLRKEIEVQKQRSSKFVTLSILIIVVLATIILLLLFRQHIIKVRKQNSSLMCECTELQERNVSLHEHFETARNEIERLKTLRKNRGYGNRTLMLIRRRFDLLNKIIMGKIVDNMKHDSEEALASFLGEKGDFVDSNRAAYLVSHSGLMEKLMKKGLDENEMNYCCLYASGMNSQDISDFLSIPLKVVYRTNSAIRAKLKIKNTERSLPELIFNMFDSSAE